jgi:hypothetical protein
MMIDCDACVARGPACGDCVVTVLLGFPPVHRPGSTQPAIDLDGEEQAALAVLAGSGLVPPLRLVAAPVAEDPEERPGADILRKASPATGPDDNSGDGRRVAG